MELFDTDEYRKVVALAKETVILRAVDDQRRVAANINTLADGGPFSLFAAVFAWACAVDIGLPPGGFAALEIIDLQTGEPMDPETIPAEQAAPLWAARMVTAAHNEDCDAAWALFCAEVERQQSGAHALLALLDMAAHSLRHTVSSALRQVIAKRN